MDLQALEYTREHYNRHAGQYVDPQEALKAREAGPGAPLKKFHNNIKRLLIQRCGGAVAGAGGRCCRLGTRALAGGGSGATPWLAQAALLRSASFRQPAQLNRAHLLKRRFASNAPRLLDLCCGRGGDIWKWINAGVQYVKGIDLSEGEIEEARTRCAVVHCKQACSARRWTASAASPAKANAC